MSSTLAQACVEFDGIRSAAADALADMFVRYIVELGQLIHENAETAGRTVINVDDIYPAFQELGVQIPQLARLCCAVEEPFALSLPERFPVRRKPKFVLSIAEGCGGRVENVPTFLPEFPDAHTFCISVAHKHPFKKALSKKQTGHLQDTEFLANTFLKRNMPHVTNVDEHLTWQTWGSFEFQPRHKQSHQAQGGATLKGSFATQRMLAYTDRKLNIKVSKAAKYGEHELSESQLFRTHSSHASTDYEKADRLISGDAYHE